MTDMLVSLSDTGLIEQRTPLLCYNIDIIKCLIMKKCIITLKTYEKTFIVNWSYSSTHHLINISAAWKALFEWLALYNIHVFQEAYGGVIVSRHNKSSQATSHSDGKWG